MIGLETELYGSAIYQARLGLRGGYQMSTKGLRRDDCRTTEGVSSFSASRSDCSSFVAQLPFSVTIFERVRFQLVPEYLVPDLPRIQDLEHPLRRRRPDDSSVLLTDSPLLLRSPATGGATRGRTGDFWKGKNRETRLRPSPRLRPRPEPVRPGLDVGKGLAAPGLTAGGSRSGADRRGAADRGAPARQRQTAGRA